MHFVHDCSPLWARDPDMGDITIISMVAGAGWYACFLDGDDWQFFPLILIVTQAARHKTLGVCVTPFGIADFYGALERVDVGSNFKGYAYTTDFEVPGHVLTSRAIKQLRDLEVCYGPIGKLRTEPTPDLR